MLAATRNQGSETGWLGRIKHASDAGCVFSQHMAQRGCPRSEVEQTNSCQQCFGIWRIGMGGSNWTMQ